MRVQPRVRVAAHLAICPDPEHPHRAVGCKKPGDRKAVSHFAALTLLLDEEHKLAFAGVSNSDGLGAAMVATLGVHDRSRALLVAVPDHAATRCKQI